MSKKSIKAIGEIAMCLPEASEYCIDVLLTFLSWEIEYITSQTLVVIRGKCSQLSNYRGKVALKWHFV